MHKFPPSAWKHLFKLRKPCGIYYENKPLLLDERATCASCAMFISFHFFVCRNVHAEWGLDWRHLNTILCQNLRYRLYGATMRHVAYEEWWMMVVVVGNNILCHVLTLDLLIIWLISSVNFHSCHVYQWK